MALIGQATVLGRSLGIEYILCTKLLKEKDIVEAIDGHGDAFPDMIEEVQRTKEEVNDYSESAVLVKTLTRRQVNRAAWILGHALQGVKPPVLVMSRGVSGLFDVKVTQRCCLIVKEQCSTSKHRSRLREKCAQSVKGRWSQR